MSTVIKSVSPGSPASRTSIVPGDSLRRINGKMVRDILDYKYHTYDSRLLLELTSQSGKLKFIRIRKTEGQDIGLEFEKALMDNERSCANKCIFCFIDQLPEGMRDTLYYKDDDVRLSFLQGNYITLTNLSRRDVERIIKLRISPVNVSVHSLDPVIRARLLGIHNGAAGLDALRAMAGAGLSLNCQVVCCPGINDGDELRKTIEGFRAFGRAINSVSIVPVGLTSHRAGLYQLEPFDRALAIETVRMVEEYGKKCRRERGSTVFFCADELYISAGIELPSHGFYEDYPQLENGVGMMRLFVTEFEEALGKSGVKQSGTRSVRETENSTFSIATGVIAYEYLTNLLKIASNIHGIVRGDVYAIKNNFFGDQVTVSGLVTGGDLISQLKGRSLGERLLIPQNMLRAGDSIFLDDVTVSDVSRALGVPVVIVGQDGAELFREIVKAAGGDNV